ncbi:ComEA family DNA-binding protein [Cohnella sp. GCM10020058]|uniref:ComEA family DNA-binding protein n=1 Tax=Cohnella sp. GCM10020058 TaxID=3317330 RepID=UPI003643301F
MGKKSARSVGLRSRAALLAGAAAAALLAWGWLAPTDGGVPGWEPVNAQIAAAVADAEIESGKTEGTDKSASAAAKTDSTAADRPIASGGAAKPAADGAITNASEVSKASETSGKASGGTPVVADGSSTASGGVDKTTEASAQAGSAANAGPAANTGNGAPQGAGSEDLAADGRLDINLASAAELDALPGIGPAKAEAIVQYRDAHGRFRSAESLKDVKGIGDKLLAKLLPLIKAG